MSSKRALLVGLVASHQLIDAVATVATTPTIQTIPSPEVAITIEPLKVEVAYPSPSEKKSWRQQQRELPKYLRRR